MTGSARWFPFVVVAAMVVVGCNRVKLDDFGAVPAFSLTDQSSKPVTNATFAGTPWAAAFVFTRCPMACPRVTRAMLGAQMDAKRRGIALRFVSFSIDPENDTPEVLLQYAKNYGADLASWSFLTGDAALVRTTAEKGFKIAVEGTSDPSRADFGINHGTQLVLVDGKGHIRGYYATDDPKALEQVVSDAAMLAN
jgi:cytochrome oxidase Cu insertion factor (SCO1/SenC/PrrC family)